MNKIKTATYARTATKDEDCINWQTREMEAFVLDDPKLELVSMFHDNGKSGRNTNRPGFKRMMDACRAGKIKRIVTPSLSVLTRNSMDMVAILTEVAKCGVSILFTKQGIDTAEESGRQLLVDCMIHAEIDAKLAAAEAKAPMEAPSADEVAE